MTHLSMSYLLLHESLFSRTFSLDSAGNEPLLIILSRTKSAICSRLFASMSNITVPFNSRLLSSKRACNERVATCGLLHLFPPSSTSSSNLIHLWLSWIYLSREKQILSLSGIEFNKGTRLPGCFLPFHLVTILDELLHLGEKRMGFVCIVANFFAQNKLHPLGWGCNCNFRHCFVNRQFLYRVKEKTNET